MAAYKDGYYNHVKHLTEKGFKMLQEQEQLAQKYKYKPIPVSIATELHNHYINELPDFWKDGKYKVQQFQITLYDGTVLATHTTDRGYVCGDYGVFIEIPPDAVNFNVIKVQEGEEYRINDPKYSYAKYHWYTDIFGNGIKLYHQQKTVAYADYKQGMWYISPYEVDVKIS